MLILHYNYFNVWYRTRVAHCTFEITLLQAIMLTLLLVCSFSPKVQSIFWGPRICAVAISHCDKSLFCEHVVCFVFDQSIAARDNRLSYACILLFPTGTKVSRGVPDFPLAMTECFARKGTTAVIHIQCVSETFSLQKIIY